MSRGNPSFHVIVHDALAYIQPSGATERDILKDMDILKSRCLVWWNRMLSPRSNLAAPLRYTFEATCVSRESVVFLWWYLMHPPRSSLAVPPREAM
jgi:hypothetical protein